MINIAKKIVQNFLIIIFLSFLINVCIVEATEEQNNIITPVQAHGKLKVEGKNIVDEHDRVFQLRGISTHGIGLTSYYHKFISQESFNYMRDEWGINVVRLTRYTPNNDAEYLSYLNREELVKQGIEYAINSGLYVIIDWHVLKPGDPNTYKTEAIEYFKNIANSYKDYPNIIYEICNEPNGDGVTWEDSVKPFAEEVIGEIRKIDTDNIIAVGSSTWSQDVDIVAQNPITEYDNLVYTLHFYASSHKEKLRNKLRTALQSNLPILISEFGACKANGDGDINAEEAEEWMNLLNENKIGFIIWQLTNKDEGSSLIRNDVTKLTDWTYDELSAHGKWFVDLLKKYPDDNKIINPIYKYLLGEKLTYTIGTDKTATFRIDADYSLFQNGGKVYIDDVLVDSNKYISETGSTIITFSKEYMSSLTEGSHNLKIIFNNNGIAETTFNVAIALKNNSDNVLDTSNKETNTNQKTTSQKANENIKSEINSQVSTEPLILEQSSVMVQEPQNTIIKKIIKNPHTGDNLILYISSMFISIVGIIVTVVFIKIEKI